MKFNGSVKPNKIRIKRINKGRGWEPQAGVNYANEKSSSTPTQIEK